MSEETKARRRASRMAHKTHLNEYHRQWAAENPDKVAEYGRRYNASCAPSTPRDPEKEREEVREIASRITSAMEEKGVTVSQLCAGAGIGRSRWYRLKDGAYDFTRREVRDIAALLGMEVTAFFSAP